MCGCNLPSRIEQMARFRGSDYKWKAVLITHGILIKIKSRGINDKVEVWNFEIKMLIKILKSFSNKFADQNKGLIKKKC